MCEEHSLVKREKERKKTKISENSLKKFENIFEKFENNTKEKPLKKIKTIFKNESKRRNTKHKFFFTKIN